MVEEKLLMVPQVAERMQVKPDAVRRWIREGKLRAILPGGTKTGYRVRESDLQRFIEERVTE